VSGRRRKAVKRGRVSDHAPGEEEEGSLRERETRFLAVSSLRLGRG